MKLKLTLALVVIYNVLYLTTCLPSSSFNLLTPSRWKEGSKINLESVFYSGLQLAFNEALSSDQIGEQDFPERFVVPDLIAAAGYPIEVHHVTTEDGYILELHRIPHGKFRDGERKKNRPILVNHCLFCSSSTFIAPGPGKALGYLLADRGYDVWIMNDRGNTYSRNHTFLSPEEKKFWLFSVDEIGMYDLPATIDYILNITTWNQIDYVGFSMGTASFVVLLSENPQYNEKIRQAALLAPVISGHFTRGPFVRITRLAKQFEGLLRGFNATEEIPPPELKLNDFLMRACAPDSEHLEDICDAVFHLIEGSHIKGVSKKSRAQFFRSFPNRGSARQLKHYSQVFRNGFFRKYSFGRNENMKKYGQPTPPTYDFTKITTPVGIFWSPSDKFESYQDSLIFASEIKNLQLFHRIPYKNFLHTNFIWDDNVYQKLHRHVLKFLSEFSQRNLKIQDATSEESSSNEHLYNFLIKKR